MEPKRVIEKQIEPVSEQTSRNRTFTFRNILIGVMIAFAILTVLAKFVPYFPFDVLITKEIQEIKLPLFDFVMRSMTWMGQDIPGVVIIISSSLLLGVILSFKNGLMLLLSDVGAILLSQIFKVIVSRPRPDPTIISQIGHFSRSDSFPSGHVMFAVGFFGFLLFLVYSHLKRNILRRVLITICIILMILMGLSRIYLGAHWFSDTLGAYLLGTIWLYIVIYVYHKVVKV